MVDISAGTRELVDISAEAVSMLGQHLHQIGELIDGAKLTAPPPGNRSAMQKMKEKAALFTEYQNDKQKEKEEIEKRINADWMRMKEWRKHAGNEGASLLDELNSYIQKVKEMKEELEMEGIKLVQTKEQVRDALVVVKRKEAKLVKPCQKIINLEHQYSDNAFLRAALCSWVQNTFDEVRFQFRAAQEKEKLRIETHQKMRKARAKSRLDIIHVERDKRLLQACFLRFQEEEVEGRHARHLFEIRAHLEDKMMILEAQVAQALGDEEAAKALIEEQQRRMEAVRAECKEAQRLQKIAEREKRAALEDARHQRELCEEAMDAKAQAEKERDAARQAQEDAEAEREAANVRAEKADAARKEAEEARAQAEEDLRRKLKKIDSLQRMLAELGAESDSDCPPDERPPAFFVNDDGTRIPRPRTRKERMAMAYREAEVARWEMRLGLAVMIDKDVNSAATLDKLKFELRLTERECDEVRWANKVLIADVNSIHFKLKNARKGEIAVQTVPEDGGIYADFSKAAFATSSVGMSPFDPTRPQFSPVKDNPNLLAKSPSAPIVIPSLCSDSVIAKGTMSEKFTLAPLRRKKRAPTQWQVGWH
jgi:colicin import membrane protein